jgi:hypothetical protein
MKYFLLVFITGILVPINLSAQENSEDLEKFPAQITFFYPIGTNGFHSHKYIYKLSLNVLAGRTGAVDGFEAAGWINLNDKYFKGFQAAGIGNINGGYGYGFQGAGIFNLIAHDFTGFQGSGIINLNGGYSKAIQAAGIGNLSMGIEGAQFAGILNVSGDIVDGAQAAGIVNATTEIKGAQLAGIANAAVNVKGAQISGIVNVAKNVEGIQLAGIVNICDSIDGVPLALLSYVRKNGYRVIEVSTTENAIAQASFKSGIRRLYTIFTVAYYDKNPNYNIGYGFGVGSGFVLANNKSAIDIELRTTQVTQNFETRETLLINSANVDYSIILFNRMELFGGPTCNLLVASNSLSAAQIAPKWARAYKYDNRIWGWFGFHAGLRF